MTLSAPLNRPFRPYSGPALKDGGMKRIALIIATATLGLSAPAAASAQSIRDLMDQVIQVQQGRPDRGEGRGRGDGPRGGPPQSDWRPAAPAGREISMSQAIRIVQGVAGPGHHLDGSREERGGRPVYRIQWATDRGERRNYIVDAQTGAVTGGR